MSSSDTTQSTRSKRVLLLFAAIIVIGGGGAWWLSSLGDDESTTAAASKPAATKDTTASSDAATSSQFSGLRSYVDEHSSSLVTAVDELATASAEYAALVERHEGDYAAVAEKDADAARDLLETARAAFVEANPAYEEMEGIVAGVPSLAKYDVSIDAGAPAADDPEGAVEFDVVVSDDLTLKQPGNYFLLTEATLWGTEADWSSGVAFDVDGNDSTKDFGDLLPKADVLEAVTRDFAAETIALQKDAAAWTPTDADAYTALAVMTPTMGEYFTSWKQSRFVAGDDATERGFVAASRLSDVVGILTGLEVIRESLGDGMADTDAAAAAAVEQDLAALTAFVDDIRAKEADGTTYTAAQADRLGADAQEQAEQITARVTDIARERGITIDA